ncbi:PERQ amino acid-rich with GYF domain-containing protein 1, partial [Ophiophagus hannah]
MGGVAVPRRGDWQGVSRYRRQGLEAEACLPSLPPDQKDPRPGPEEKKLPAPPGTPWQPSPPFVPLAVTAASNCENIGPGNSSKAEKLALLSSGKQEAEAVDGDPGPLGCPAQPTPAAVPPLPAAPSAAPAAEFTVGDNEDEDGMKHLQQEAEKMVASLQDSSLEEEHFGQAIADHRNTAAALPLSHEAAMKWFYKDPQGEIQGPFTTQEMAEWFQAGYFAMSLLVKRGCDEGFQPLGELQERRGAELRAKRDEDERKRREEEELYRRKQARASAGSLPRLRPTAQRGLGRRLPSSSSWGQQSVNASSGQNSFSLADLQKLGDTRACRELREECRHQEMLQKLLQQQQQQSTQPLWGGLAKQSPSLKALLELQQESERHLQKPAQARAQQRAAGGPLGLWEESMKGPGPLARNLGLRNSRSSPSLGDAYSVSSRQSRKKTEEEEKLLKLLQGIQKPPQDGFTQWCEQMLHALNASSSLDVPTVVAFLKEMESPYDVHDCIRSCLGDTLEAKEFAKQFLERRAKQRANQQRQQQQQEASWLSSSSLQSLFQANHSPKPPSFENSQAVKIKRRPVMLHADPSILDA